MSRLHPTPVVDKNGVLTTRNKKADVPDKSSVRRGIPSPKAPSATKETDWDSWRSGLNVPEYEPGEVFEEYTKNGNPVTIYAGEIDREAINVYLHGQCMALASSLAEAGVGTPVVAFEKGTANLAHALVRLPDGMLVDIEKVHDPEWVKKFYDLRNYETTTFSKHVEEGTNFARFSDPPNFIMADTFVEPIVSMIEQYIATNR